MNAPTPHCDLLELLDQHASAPLVLQQVAQTARLMNRDRSRAAILLNDGHGMLRHAASDGLEADYIEHVQGIRIGADAPSCGRAASTGEEVIVESVADDPCWQQYSEMAGKYEIRACWSFPIVDAEGVKGTLTIYHREPRVPSSLEQDAMRYLAKVAGLALQN